SIKPANDAQAAYQEKALKIPAFYVARLVSFLASDAASHVSGQLFGARGRELFVFSQPRPAQRLLQPHGGFELAAFGAAARALEPGRADPLREMAHLPRRNGGVPPPRALQRACRPDRRQRR